jgi:hypothetical protein
MDDREIKFRSTFFSLHSEEFIQIFCVSRWLNFKHFSVLLLLQTQSINTICQNPNNSQTNTSTITNPTVNNSSLITNSTEEPRRKRQEASRPNHILLFTIINPVYPITVVSSFYNLIAAISTFFFKFWHFSFSGRMFFIDSSVQSQDINLNPYLRVTAAWDKKVSHKKNLNFLFNSERIEAAES